MRRSAPRPVAGPVEALVGRLAPATLLAEVQAVWADAVGETIAENAQPTGERDGIVTVGCSAAVWAHELDLLGLALVERINAALGRPAVSALRCRAAGGGPRTGAGASTEQSHFAGRAR